jgi:hypothetical protein
MTRTLRGGVAIAVPWRRDACPHDAKGVRGVDGRAALHAPAARVRLGRSPPRRASRVAPTSSVAPGIAVPSSLPRSALGFLLVSTALAACSGPNDPIGGGSQPRFDLYVRVLDAGDTVPVFSFGPPTPNAPVRLAPAGGLIVATGQLWPGEVNGRMRRVTDGRVVVNGTELRGTIPSGQNVLAFNGEAGTPRADGVVTFTLPRVDGLAPIMLRMQGVARAEGTTAALSGGELRLRVVPPPSTLEPPFYGMQWNVALRRGDRTTRVEGTTPLPRELVLPVGSLLPGTGAVSATLTHMVSASSSIARPTAGDTDYAYNVSMQTSLRFAPVAP